jgi:hypothetical protein
MEATSTPPPPPATPVAATPIIPWEDPARAGLFDRFVETVKLLVMNPREAFAGMPTSGGIGQPLFYAVIVGWIGAAVALVWNVLFQSAWLPFMDMGDAGAAFGFSIVTTFIIAVLAPLFIIFGVFVGAAIFHLMLMLVGGANNGFEATVRVVCYASTSQLANIIPFCGGLVALVWAIILYVFGLSTAHRTTTGKALIAILLPLVLCCIIGVFMALAGGVLAGLAASSAQ